MRSAWDVVVSRGGGAHLCEVALLLRLFHGTLQVLRHEVLARELDVIWEMVDLLVVL